MGEAKSPRTKRVVKTRRKPIPPGLKYDVLARANFRCQACGVSAAIARLEIDHKLPVSKGGVTTLSNLQALCVSCNRGKGAKLRAAQKSVSKRRSNSAKPSKTKTSKKAKKP